MSTEVVLLTKEAAETELATINAAISSIYASIATGNGITKWTVGSKDFHRTYEKASPEALLESLQERAASLRQYIATFTVTADSVPKFNPFSNIPMIFRKNS